ncbi:tetratricopeptide repeat protein [Aequorivita marina]|uniref:tetratricopeptide repeat protein n=1 Tax=Aequorivita marina TaxID=3073654 RepID=UPI002876BBA6|nr:tetratricopeptide repeat protein [Aequorivita sp. S2608]MDS1299259.1 tetratricopeptide repeat protein [Aequorivita sp. S2608]
MKKKQTYKVFLLVGFCLLTTISTAQKELDSILEDAKNIIFDNPNKAISIGTEVFSEATQAETKVNALMLISNGYLSQRDNPKSLEYALKTRDYLNQISSLKLRIRILNTIGMQHQQLRIYDKAIEYLDEALMIANRVKQPDSLASILGYNYSIRGFIYREQMSCEIALNYFDKAIFQFEKNSERKSTRANLSTLNYNKGNCFLQISQIDSARINFNRSIVYAQEVGANSLVAFGKKGLSEVYTAEGNYNKAIDELKKAEAASKKVGDLILNQGIYKNLSDNYLAQGNSDLYQFYFKKYTETQKRIYKKEQASINTSINNLIEEHNLTMKEKLFNLQITQWILISLGLISTVFLGRLIYRNQRKYKEIKEKLESIRI